MLPITELWLESLNWRRGAGVQANNASVMQLASGVAHTNYLKAPGSAPQHLLMSDRFA